MSEEPDKIAYHKALYQKSAKHRVSRINQTRRRRGQPEISSLSEVKIRIPVAQ